MVLFLGALSAFMQIEKKTAGRQISMNKLLNLILSYEKLKNKTL